MNGQRGYRALRRGRVSVPRQIYLVTFVTRGRRPLFREPGSARVAARTLSLSHAWLGAEVLCWTLMPDHWHGLVELPEGETLSRCVNRAKSASARNINQVLKRRGSVWQDGFHDHALRDDEALRAVARYIVANPLRAGLVKRIGDYPYWDAVWLQSG